MWTQIFSTVQDTPQRRMLFWYNYDLKISPNYQASNLRNLWTWLYFWLQSKQDKQCTYKHNIESRSRSHCCRGKAMIITYSESVFVALVILHAKRMRHIVWLSVACLAVPSFSTVSHKRDDFRKILFEHKVCLLIFCTISSGTFLILRRTGRNMIKNVHLSSCKVPVIPVRF